MSCSGEFEALKQLYGAKRCCFGVAAMVDVASAEENELESNDLDANEAGKVDSFFVRLWL